MFPKDRKNIMFRRTQSGIALILTIIILTVLSAIVYRLSSTLTQQRHRQQYMIDYQKARYACESGLKYALSVAEEIDPNYVSRPNEPDFSDLFTLNDEEYKQMISEWAAKLGIAVDINNVSKDDFRGKFISLTDLNQSNDINDSNHEDYNNSDYNEPNYTEPLVVRGPYGPAWPYINKPIIFNMDDAVVTVKTEDENAKMPITWGISGDVKTERESEAALVTFCEWMQMQPEEIDSLKAQLKKIKKIKEFKLKLAPVIMVIKKPRLNADENTASTRSRRRSTRRRRSRRDRRSRSRRTSGTTTTVKIKRPPIGHTRDFSKLMHSPLLNTEMLAKPLIKSDDRTESALKYLSLWGTWQVNINSAPRQVLEAAFTYGGDAVDIAEAIIQERKYEPFVDIEDLKRRLIQYSDSIEKSKAYITTESTVFTIKVTAISGVARVSATAAIKRINGKIEKIGIISN